MSEGRHACLQQVDGGWNGMGSLACTAQWKAKKCVHDVKPLRKCCRKGPCQSLVAFAYSPILVMLAKGQGMEPEGSGAPLLPPKSRGQREYIGVQKARDAACKLCLH
eukprot:1161733-Pelagomonas_calceolata.AAC.11